MRFWSLSLLILCCFYRIVGETDDMLVVDKPASIPVHPCGRFRMNTVMYILAKERGLNNLRIVSNSVPRHFNIVHSSNGEWLDGKYEKVVWVV